MPAAGPSLEALRATVERMEARASAPNDPSLAESRRLYAELAERFQNDLRAPRDVALAKSAALMVLQALAQARSRAHPRREDQRAVTARAGATAARSSSARASSSGSGLLKK